MKIKHNLLLLLLANLLASPLAVRAEKNEPVPGAEVVLATFDANGQLQVIGEPGSTGPDGKFELELPAGFPEHKPVFAVVQDPNSANGTQQVSCMPKEGEGTVDPQSTAIGNAFFGFMKESEEHFHPQDIDHRQIEDFVGKMKETLNGVPLADNAQDSVERFADVMGLHPGDFLKATKKFNIPAEDKFKVAALINDAAAPEGFNVLDGKAPPLGDIPAGSHIPGLIPPSQLNRFAPGDFDFNQIFGDNVMPPGGLKGKIPDGTFLLPPGIKANPKVDFPENIVLPQGVTIPKKADLPPGAVIPPGVIIDDGFIPPIGMQFPPGVILPPDFDPTQHGAEFAVDFKPPVGFVPPPGFGVTDANGGFIMPEGFPIPEGFQLPEGAKQFPTPVGFIPPEPPKGFEGQDVPPFDPNFAFANGAILPPGFNPNDHGLLPPPNFDPKEFGGTFDNFDQFKDPNFEAFDPLKGFDPNAEFGGFHGPALDANGNPIVGFDPSQHGANPPPEGFNPFQHCFDPTTGEEVKCEDIKPGAPNAPKDPNGGHKPNDPNHNGDDCIDPTTGQPGLCEDGQPHDPNAGHDPNNPNHNGDPCVLPDGTLDPNCQNGEHDPNAGHDPNDPNHDPNAGNNQPPHDPNPGHNGGNGVVATNNTITNILSGELTTASFTLPQSITETSKVKITASEGVYVRGKAKYTASTVELPILISPSISSTSVQVTVNVDNAIQVTDITVNNQAVQLVASLADDTKHIQLAATEGVTLTSSKVKAYLLAPGTSAFKLQKAKKYKAKVEEAQNAQIVSFKKPKRLDAGIYTVVFNDGDNAYFGLVTIGIVETQTITGTVLAPGGQL